MIVCRFKPAVFFISLAVLLFADPAAPRERDGMVLVQGECFEMGDTFEEGKPDEKPTHRVCLSDFWIDKYEVTQKQFGLLMGGNPSRFKGCDNCPVDSVSWFKSKAYCSFAGKRLPTEAEWEYAARERGKKVKYGAGKDSITKKEANYNGSRPLPVGGFTPNALGIYDMSGNLREWAGDWYDKDYYNASRLENPKGPGVGQLRVLRGGYWGDDPERLRATVRQPARPGVRHFANGFRCAKR